MYKKFEKMHIEEKMLGDHYCLNKEKNDEEEEEQGEGKLLWWKFNDRMKKGVKGVIIKLGVILKTGAAF